MTLRGRLGEKMPATPKNSSADEARFGALIRWQSENPYWAEDAREGFFAGWRAAMAEVKKERDHADEIVRQERAEQARWDRSWEGF